MVVTDEQEAEGKITVSSETQAEQCQQHDSTVGSDDLKQAKDCCVHASLDVTDEQEAEGNITVSSETQAEQCQQPYSTVGSDDLKQAKDCCVHASLDVTDEEEAEGNIRGSSETQAEQCQQPDSTVGSDEQEGSNICVDNDSESIGVFHQNENRCASFDRQVKQSSQNLNGDECKVEQQNENFNTALITTLNREHSIKQLEVDTLDSVNPNSEVAATENNSIDDSMSTIASESSKLEEIREATKIAIARKGAVEDEVKRLKSLVERTREELEQEQKEVLRMQTHAELKKKELSKSLDSDTTVAKAAMLQMEGDISALKRIIEAKKEEAEREAENLTKVIALAEAKRIELMTESFEEKTNDTANLEYIMKKKPLIRRSPVSKTRASVERKFESHRQRSPSNKIGNESNSFLVAFSSSDEKDSQIPVLNKLDQNESTEKQSQQTSIIGSKLKKKLIFKTDDEINQCVERDHQKSSQNKQDNNDVIGQIKQIKAMAAERKKKMEKKVKFESIHDRLLSNGRNRTEDVSPTAENVRPSTQNLDSKENKHVGFKRIHKQRRESGSPKESDDDDDINDSLGIVENNSPHSKQLSKEWRSFNHIEMDVRTSEALYTLHTSRQLTQIMEAIRSLEMSSRLSYQVCEDIASVNAAPILYKLIRLCNRSSPHLVLLQHILMTLSNVSKIETLMSATVTADCADILIDVLQMFRDKDEILSLASTLLRRVVFSDSNIAVSYTIFLFSFRTYKSLLF